MYYKFVEEKEFIFRSHEFSELYQVCFGQKLTTDEIVWRYLNNPNKKLIACFAYDGDKLIGNYSVSPIKIKIGDKIYPALLSLNTMTNPEYSGKGIFVDLANKVYDYATSLGYIGVIGFPNYISNRIFITKLDWNDIMEIPMLSLNTKNLSNIISLDDNIKYDNDFSLDYSHVQLDSSYCVYKDDKYFKWRYTNHPTNKYYNIVINNSDNQVISYIIFKHYQNYLNIIDFSYIDVDSFEILLNYLCNYALKSKCKKITTWAKIGTKEHLYLEKLGFRNMDGATYFGARLFDTSISKKDFFDTRNWYISLGDDNVY